MVPQDWAFRLWPALVLLATQRIEIAGPHLTFPIFILCISFSVPSSITMDYKYQPNI